jgi:hypothetical protein
MGRLAGLLVATLVIGGCGSADPTGGDADRPATSLTIVFREAPGAATRTVTLECDPAGGTHPDPAAACAALAALEHPFAPTPKDRACTELYGGPQTATVEGRLDGGPVSTSFARTNGCEIERWSRHGFLLPFGSPLGPS